MWLTLILLFISAGGLLWKFTHPTSKSNSTEAVANEVFLEDVVQRLTDDESSKEETDDTTQANWEDEGGASYERPSEAPRNNPAGFLADLEVARRSKS